jgi:hypothetical protein
MSDLKAVPPHVTIITASAGFACSLVTSAQLFAEAFVLGEL